MCSVNPDCTILLIPSGQHESALNRTMTIPDARGALLAVVVAGLLCSASAGITSFTIGGWLPGTSSEISSKLKPLFEDYLNSYFRTALNSSVTFEFIPVDYDADSYANKKIRANQLDFLYTLSGRMVCVEAEFGWIPVVTQRAGVVGKETGAQGSILYSLKTNKKVRNISDFKDAMIGLLVEHGIELFVDVPKVVFYGNDYQAQVDDVVNGKLDVGILPSSWMIENAPDILASKLVVHNPSSYIYEDEEFPFPTSTPLAPQPGLMASPAVPWLIKEQVTDALTNLTKDHPAAVGAGIATFTMPGFFANVRHALDDLGLIHQPTLLGWASGFVNAWCHSPFDDTLETLDCPEGHVMQTLETIEYKCHKDGMVCPEGRPCLCHPCQKDLQVQVYPARVVLGLAVTLFSLALALR